MEAAVEWWEEAEVTVGWVEQLAVAVTDSVVEEAWTG